MDSNSPVDRHKVGATTPPPGDVDPNGDLVAALAARIPSESTIDPVEQARRVAGVVELARGRPW
jgi:hypothetical protein